MEKRTELIESLYIALYENLSCLLNLMSLLFSVLGLQKTMLK